MRIFMLIVFVISSAFANICEANRQNIEDKVLWEFVSKFYRTENLCEALHNLYPQMKANECQVVKVTQTQRSELCEILVSAYSLYGIKSNKNDCKYTTTDKYVKDIKNLPNILRKYVFNVKAINEFPTPNECVTKISIKHNNKNFDENVAIEKIKATLKKRNDENAMYLKFMKNEEMQQNALRIYRFVGDKMLSSFDKYYNYVSEATEIEEYENFYSLPIEYEVINWAELNSIDWVKQYAEIYKSHYVVKCYKKSPQDTVSIDNKYYSRYYGGNYSGDSIKEYGKSTMTCAELKSQMELFERVTRD